MDRFGCKSLSSQTSLQFSLPLLSSESYQISMKPTVATRPCLHQGNAALRGTRRPICYGSEFVATAVQKWLVQIGADRKSTRLNSSHYCASRMPSSAFKKNQ